MFQHTAARRRLAIYLIQHNQNCKVSTHSRPKAAGFGNFFQSVSKVFQHTAARRRLGNLLRQGLQKETVSTHSRPKAAGLNQSAIGRLSVVSTHSRPKAAGLNQSAIGRLSVVSTHSRPKAAGISLFSPIRFTRCFNTQPPEGGWPD